jgi:hypothetical protein
MEAGVGIEPTNNGFAGHCLTTWLSRPLQKDIVAESLSEKTLELFQINRAQWSRSVPLRPASARPNVENKGFKKARDELKDLDDRRS